MEESLKGYLMCFIGVFTWSFSEIIVKLLQRSGGIGPVSLSFLRFFFGALFLLAIMLFQKDIKDTWGMIKRNPKPALIGSMFGLGFSNVIYFVGMQYTQANIGAALYTSYPIFISFYSIFVLGEKSNLMWKFIGYFIGLFGILILITNFQLSLVVKQENIIGNILLVTAGAIWALYSVLGKKIFRLEKGITNIEIKWTAISFLIACVPILGILVFTNEIQTFFRYDLGQWGLILFLAFVSTAFGLYIFFIGVRKLEVSKGISMALLKPIMVVILAFIILDEVPTYALLVAIPLISGAVLVVNRRVPTHIQKLNPQPTQQQPTN